MRQRRPAQYCLEQSETGLSVKESRQVFVFGAKLNATPAAIERREVLRGSWLVRKVRPKDHPFTAPVQHGRVCRVELALNALAIRLRGEVALRCLASGLHRVSPGQFPKADILIVEAEAPAFRMGNTMY
jgi:hypothetical protein